MSDHANQVVPLWVQQCDNIPRLVSEWFVSMSQCAYSLYNCAHHVFCIKNPFRYMPLWTTSTVYNYVVMGLCLLLCYQRGPWILRLCRCHEYRCCLCGLWLVLGRWKSEGGGSGHQAHQTRHRQKMLTLRNWLNFLLHVLSLSAPPPA